MANTSSNKILMGLADRPGEDMTARLLLALTALYVERPTHTGEEEQQYVELVLRLIDKVDATTRGKAADLLRAHGGAPAEILARLDAAPSAHAIQPDGAVEVATADWPAEPPPHPLPHAGEGREGDAAETPAPSSYGAGSARGEPGDGCAAAPLAELGELFFAGNAAERRQILLQVTALAADDDGASPQPASPDDARAFAGLDAAAMEGRIGEFLREFERLLSVRKSLCERILNDRSGEPMVIAAKAANMPVAVLQRILLLVNPAVGHSVQRVFDLTDLFHDIERRTAVKLLSLWRAQARDVGAAATSEPFDSGSVGVREGAGLRSRFGALADRIRIQDGKGVSPPPVPGNAARRDLRSR